MNISSGKIYSSRGLKPMKEINLMDICQIAQRDEIEMNETACSDEVENTSSKEELYFRIIQHMVSCIE